MKVTYDQSGTPALWAANPHEAYYGLGWLHGRHRPLQALIFGAAGRGALCRYILPHADLERLDTLVLQLDLPARGHAAAKHLRADDEALLRAYLRGFGQGLRFGGQPWELRLLLARFPPLTVASTLSSLLLSSYLGLAEGQERMERALLHCLNAGADAALLERMFAPHLRGWDPDLLRGVQDTNVCGVTAPPLAAVGGSNAWAVTGKRTASGKPILCGDPHLQVNLLPALFFEVRARVDADVWLGATIPGLPGVAVGRNRNVAWSGTFSCADNVDFAVEHVANGKVQRGDTWLTPVTRTATLRRRGTDALHLQYQSTGRGVLLNAPNSGRVLAQRWAAVHAPAEALGAYMRLPMAQNVVQAARTLEGAHTLSLHWVLADRSGDVRYQQAGSVPRRGPAWSGLYPVDAASAQRWRGLYTGDDLPSAPADEDMVVSANEARLAPDGGVLATLAQPSYRKRRIEALLRAQVDHDVASMQRIQRDLLCEQGLTLRPLLLDALPPGALEQALRNWDGECHADSAGAHAFSVAYRCAQDGLAPHLGGDAWHDLMHGTEARVWFAAAIDRLLRDPSTWSDKALGASLRGALNRLETAPALSWGEAQTVTFKHMIFGDLPRWCGLNRGPRPLPGNITTVAQGNLVPGSQGSIAVAPAYRMVCDLSEDGLYTSLPGGIDGSRFSDTYACWLDAWCEGAYHRIEPPHDDEGGTVNLQP